MRQYLVTWKYASINPEVFIKSQIVIAKNKKEATEYIRAQNSTRVTILTVKEIQNG